MTGPAHALFEDPADAHAVVRALEAAGVPSDQISILTRSEVAEPEDSGAGAGATIGSVLGCAGGILAGLGLLSIPGIGPIAAAGPLVAAVTGAGVGAAAGGFAGALVGLGLSEADAKDCNDMLLRGGTVVTVSGDEQSVQLARETFDRMRPSKRWSAAPGA